MMIILNLPYPPSANAYWRSRVMNAKSAGGRPMATTYVSQEGKDFKADVLKRARAAGVTAPIAGRVKLEVWLYPSRPKDWESRVRKLGATWDDGVQCLDLDNVNKALLDALKDVVFDDDKFVRKLLSERMEPDEHGARVMVRISPIVVEQPQAALL